MFRPVVKREVWSMTTRLRNTLGIPIAENTVKSYDYCFIMRPPYTCSTFNMCLYVSPYQRKMSGRRTSAIAISIHSPTPPFESVSRSKGLDTS
ncbi:hypothetical protein TNCV_359841 [Trichonephila clavipes]|nr:hypothetical protein TNCV_359841 [Trichonephila clavipes]